MGGGVEMIVEIDDDLVKAVNTVLSFLGDWNGTVEEWKEYIEELILDDMGWSQTGIPVDPLKWIEGRFKRYITELKKLTKD